MDRIKSFDDLKSLRDDLVKAKNESGLTRVSVSMATCGIAAGGKEIFEYFKEKLETEGLENVEVTQTGCMSYCYAEPTVEITSPDGISRIFGDVDKSRVDEIITKYIENDEIVEGLITKNYINVNDISQKEGS